MTPNPGFPGWRESAARSRKAQQGRMIIAAAALAVAVGLVSACGSAKMASALSGQAQPARAAAASGHMHSRLVAEALDWFFPATAAQYTAGTQYQGEVLALTSRLVSACMTRSGFHTPVENATAAASAIWDLSQFPNFTQMRSTGLMAPDPRSAPSAPPPVPAGKQQAFNSAKNTCGATVYPPFARIQSAAASLTNSWIDTFMKIQASAKVQPTLAGFTACVEQAGAPANFAQDFNRFAVWAGGQIQGAPSYAASLRADRHWGSVFARCGQATETLFENLQTSARNAFFQTHSQQIAQLENLVSHTLTVAAGQLAGPRPPTSSGRKGQQRPSSAPR